MHCAEYQDLVAAHVDGLLTAEELPLAEAHVASCPSCARLRERSGQFQQAARAPAWVRPTPPEVRQRILVAIEAEDRPASPTSWTGGWFFQPRSIGAVAVAAALCAVMLAALLLRLHARNADPLATIVTDFRAVEASHVHLAVHTDEPAELRRYYREIGGIAFSNSVVDLQALGYKLVGGTVVQLGTHRSTMTLYRSARGMLLCHRIWAPDMPVLPGGETIGGDTFYTVNGITICMHREGDVVCFLASALPREEFIKQLTGKA